jgi:CxxC-x17-CxxC domain-containing protein
MPDKILTCRDCGSNFTFTTSEQDFFASKGFTNQPGRCPSCRSARKATSRDSGFGSGNGRRDQQMYPAVCGQCGKDTQVPFQPRGDKPVYCSPCYEGQRGRSNSGRGSGRY